jgi:hypothetical protein
MPAPRRSSFPFTAHAYAQRPRACRPAASARAALGSRMRQSWPIRGGFGWPAGKVNALHSPVRLKDYLFTSRAQQHMPGGWVKRGSDGGSGGG